MHQEQGASAVGLGGGAQDGLERGVHRRYDPVHRAAVLHLEAVDGVAFVGDVAHLEEGVQVFGEGAEGNRVLAHEPSCCRMLSSAAWTRARRAAGTSESRAGLGT